MPPLPPLVVICGATATGKTGLSLEVAERLGEVEIISADSRQVYRGMDVGTAKVSLADRARVPHHGLDLVEPDEPFSVAAFQRHALDALGGIGARGRVALLVGGTGLYLRAVARGLPLGEGSADPRLRASLEAELADRGLPALAAELSRLAPSVAARTDLANPRRVTRGLERARLGGDRPPSPPRGYEGPLLWLGLRVEQQAHREWIAARAAAQFARGLLEEVASLRRRFSDDLRAFSAIGYREAMAVQDGRMDRAAAVAETTRRTFDFARRQRTWFRSEPDVEWLDAEGLQPAAVANRVRAFLDARSSSPSQASAMTFRPARSLAATAKRICDDERARLGRLVPSGELLLTGSSSMPEMLTRGDVDLQLRVPASDFDGAVEELRGAYDEVHPEIWTTEFATFEARGHQLPTGIAVTAVGGEHDRLFLDSWAVLARDAAQVEAYNDLKRAHEGGTEEVYLRAKRDFFANLAAGRRDG